MSFRGSFAPRCLAGALLVTSLIASSAATAAVSSGPLCYQPRVAERGFAKKVNSARMNNGFGKLRLDPQLSKAARVHTKEMARQTSLYHTPSSTLRSRVTNWIVLGENVGVGDGVSSLHTAFMNSPAHRDNVLHSGYRHVGIGTKRVNGRLWVTILFEGVSDPGTTLWMRRC